MSGRLVRVTAGSRLHFGMIAPSGEEGRHYGGVGAMIDQPRLVLTIREAAEFETHGPMADRARQAAQSAAAVLGPSRQAVRIDVLEAPPQHVGLGSGTQLAMAVAAGLARFWDRPIRDPAELARSVGRGQRSAIGLHGFVHGGLLYETGKADGQAVAPLAGRVELPAAWRFVLIRPTDAEGLYGDLERSAFAGLPPVPRDRVEALKCEAAERLLPLARAGRFEEFGESLYRFGYLAGLSFAALQGGPFAGPRLTAMVEWLRARGVRGVGQSSWGPTLFALAPSQSAAEALTSELRRRDDGRELDLRIAAPAACGAQVAFHPSSG